MKSIYLCGHTGSSNRGCEAIVLSTSYILNILGNDINHRFLLTYDKKYDEYLNLNNNINLISYPKRGKIKKGIGYTFSKFGKLGIWYNEKLFMKLLEINNKTSILFTIGGDTYCYSKPFKTYAFNNLAKKRKIPNIFFGCSIDTKTIQNKEMCKDINKYTYIIARESISKEIFEKILIDKTKLLYACDPAFQLPTKEVRLPDNFKIKNTVGINLSPLVFTNYNNLDDIMYKNVFNLINYIIDKTDMNICLIPHVYNVKSNSQDLCVLNNIYKKYVDNKRVSIINEELSCTELKYIISQCRFFVGARTHSTIAAYSTGVPTIVLSYSIKSRGIAKDLFGKEEGFLIRWQDVKNENDIKKIFVKSLLKNECEIIEKYNKILPFYKNTIIDATKKVLESLDYNE